MQTEQLEIELSKIKIFLVLIGSLLFIFLGIHLAFYNTNNSDLFLKIVGLSSIAFFSLTFFASLIKIFDSKKGLIILKNGIFENSSFVSLGFIKWDDILEIETITSTNQKFCMIYLKSSKEYIKRHKGLKRRIASMNYKMYGTPVFISSNSLKISFNDLNKLLKTNFMKYKKLENQ